MIGSKFSRHFFNQSEVKPKPIVARACTFSRALCRLRVITLSFDWFTGLSPTFLIGQSNYFGFDFTTLNWNSLYDMEQALAACSLVCVLVVQNDPGACPASNTPRVYRALWKPGWVNVFRIQINLLGFFRGFWQRSFGTREPAKNNGKGISEFAIPGKLFGNRECELL